jgi:hypothetical protein
MKVYNLTDVSDKPRKIGMAAYTIVDPGAVIDAPEYLRGAPRVVAMVENKEIALDSPPDWYTKKGAPAKKPKAVAKKAAPKKEAAPKVVEAKKEAAPKKTTKKMKKAKK